MRTTTQPVVAKKPLRIENFPKPLKFNGYSDVIMVYRSFQFD
jgi:hypothetical protein